MTSAGMVSAQDAAMPEESRQRFDLGQQAFERGDFAVALSEWERVHALMEGHPRRAYLLYKHGARARGARPERAGASPL
jgi:cytochrome c-type biogenesis protein CcmH/NrfG